MAAMTDTAQFKTGGKRFNFVCAKRTFTMLDSPYFSKYTENLICEEIVLKMGLTIFDRKCETISVSGFKTEVVGCIKTTAQCLKNGAQNGTLFIKARVVRDFYKLFGSDGLCSEKMKKKLISADDSYILEDSQENAFDTEPTEPTEPKKKKPKPTNNIKPFEKSQLVKENIQRTPKTSSTSLESPSRASLSGFSTPSKSPLGFPPSPQKFPTKIPPNGKILHPPIHVPANLPTQPSTSVMSPYSANISRLTTAFGDADLIKGSGQRQAYLAELDPGGKLMPGASDLSYAFYRSRDPVEYPSATHGFVYQSGHGRTWCRIGCKNLEFHPHNCGHHPQWKLPDGFQYCGIECKCGLCECIKNYDDYGYYG